LRRTNVRSNAATKGFEPDGGERSEPTAWFKSLPALSGVRPLRAVEPLLATRTVCIHVRRTNDDDPFDDFFEQIERMMNEMMGDAGSVEMQFGGMPADAGFGSDTHIDVHQEGDTVRAVADLPGVTKQDIDLTCDGRVLTLRAANDRRQYEESVRLPVPVDERSADATYNNGVLEVQFEAADQAADIDVE
jgi:HSP20 family protein